MNTIVSPSILIPLLYHACLNIRTQEIHIYTHTNACNMCQLTVQAQYTIAGVDCYCNKCIIIMHLQFEEMKINSIFISSDF